MLCAWKTSKPTPEVQSSNLAYVGPAGSLQMDGTSVILQDSSEDSDTEIGK